MKGFGTNEAELNDVLITNNKQVRVLLHMEIISRKCCLGTGQHQSGI
jgi:hypothetical protein